MNANTNEETTIEELERARPMVGRVPAAAIEGLIERAAAETTSDAGELARLHEALLFFRAYPASVKGARYADAALESIAARVSVLEGAGRDMAPLSEPEISGIAGTSFSAVFTYPVVRQLAARYPGALEIDWDSYAAPERLGPVAALTMPVAGEDWPIEAHMPVERWIRAAAPQSSRGGQLGWLLERIAALPWNADDDARARLYDALELPVKWDLKASPGASRTLARLPISRRELYVHNGPLLRRADVSLEQEMAAAPLPVRPVAPADAARLLETIVDTSAVRYRELYGFTHADHRHMLRAEAGRGLEIFVFGVPPALRLPLRAYHGGMFFKNGVPAGYVEVLSLAGRAEVGFNLYYTFREGESAWLYARMLRLFHQLLGVTCFSVDPYQIGYENSEAIDSGAFWFYRKLGFRPVEPAIARLVKREEHRIAAEPGYRTPRRRLARLAEGPVVYELPGGAPAGFWDRFSVRNLGLTVQRAAAEQFDGDTEKLRRVCRARARRALGVECPGDLGVVIGLIGDLGRWTAVEKAAAAAVVRAKQGPDEGRYLRLMQRHGPLCGALVGMGEA
jgi:hypothetical protein